MRAQTTLDFAVGISVFLITSVFVFAFVPGLLQPFNEGAQEETVAADRLASQLSETMLVGEDPYLLQTDCTTEFFLTDPSTGGAPAGACRFNQSTDLDDPTGLTDRVGRTDRQRLNVTIREPTGDRDRLCWDDDAGTVIPAEHADCDPTTDDVVYAAGAAPPAGSSSVVTATRTVGIQGDDVRLTVRMW